MTDNDIKQRLADQVLDLTAHLKDKQYAVLVWDGDVWCATVSYDITKEKLLAAGEFWTSAAEKLP